MKVHGQRPNDRAVYAVSTTETTSLSDFNFSAEENSALLAARLFEDFALMLEVDLAFMAWLQKRNITE